MIFDSLDQAVDFFSHEADCTRIWMSMRWPNGVKCPRCNAASRMPDNRSRVQCNNCQMQFNAVSGTPLQGTRLPIGVWLLVLWGMVQDPPLSGDIISRELIIPRQGIFRIRRIIRNIKRDFPRNIELWEGDPFQILLRELTVRPKIHSPIIENSSCLS